MRRWKNTVGLLLVLALSVPTGAGVSVDYDSEADFSGYKTFAWQEGTPAVNPLMHKRVVRSIETQLVSMGMTKSEENPDVFVVYHVALDQDRRVQVDDFGYWGRWRGPWYGAEVEVFDVQVGTLIVDLLDAGSGDGVWRGAAQQDLPPNPKPEKIEKKLRKVLMKMFRKFPPE